MSKGDTFIELKGIVKLFPGVRALDGVSFDIREGEVHSLCGENGAGKSTLIKVMTGVHPRNEGDYLIDGQSERTIWDTASAVLAIKILVLSEPMPFMAMPNMQAQNRMPM